MARVQNPVGSLVASTAVTDGSGAVASHLFADNYRDRLQEHKNNEDDLKKAVKREMDAYLNELESAGVVSNTQTPINEWSRMFLASYRDAFGNNAGVLAK